MNLKDAFRAQNKLQALVDEAIAHIMTQKFVMASRCTGRSRNGRGRG